MGLRTSNFTVVVLQLKKKQRNKQNYHETKQKPPQQAKTKPKQQRKLAKSTPKLKQTNNKVQPGVCAIWMQK